MEFKFRANFYNMKIYTVVTVLTNQLPIPKENSDFSVKHSALCI